MFFPIEINGLPIKAEYSEDNIEHIFIPLLRKITEIQCAKKERVLVLLAAPPGGGKSTLSQFLKYLSENTEGLKPINVIGMDGFHRYQDYLLSHEVEKDGVRIPMVNIKGAPITFDLELLLERVKRVAQGENCGWPDYDRTKHNPQEDAVTVNGDIVLLEGNYLLLKDEGWNKLKEFADFTIGVTADKELLRNRLIERKEMLGKSHEEAVKFVDYSDMANVEVVLNNSAKADLELRVLEDGTYEQ